MDILLEKRLFIKLNDTVELSLIRVGDKVTLSLDNSSMYITLNGSNSLNLEHIKNWR